MSAAAQLLDAVVPIVRTRLPRGVGVDYLDDFVDRNRSMLELVIEQNLGPMLRKMEAANDARFPVEDIPEFWTRPRHPLGRIVSPLEPAMSLPMARDSVALRSVQGVPLILLFGCAAPGPSIGSAQEVGIVSQPSTITGRDGGGGAEVFGQSVWTSGDTVLSVADENGTNWHNNSYTFATLPTGSAADGIVVADPTDSVGAPREFMPPTAFEATFNEAHFGDPCAEEPCSSRWANWPGTPQWDPGNERALVTYAILYLGEDEDEHVGGGHSVAVWSDVNAQPERPVVDAGSEFPDIIWGPEARDWGTASTVSDGFFWVYACDEAGWDRPCRLARAPVDSVQSPEAWTYWDGDGWSASSDSAVELFDGAPIMSLGWNAYLGAWLVVYSPPFDGVVKARTAPELTGPWSKESVVFEVPESEGDAPYDASHHPDLAEHDGKVEYITWSRHTTGWFGSEFVVLRVEFL